MPIFFLYFGVISFTLISFWILYFIYVHYSFYFYEKKRKYHDYCFLANMGWTDDDFDNFIINGREKMTNEEYKLWEKTNIKFWYSWICFKKRKY